MNIWAAIIVEGVAILTLIVALLWTVGRIRFLALQMLELQALTTNLFGQLGVKFEEPMAPVAVGPARNSEHLYPMTIEEYSARERPAF